MYDEFKIAGEGERRRRAFALPWSWPRNLESNITSGNVARAVDAEHRFYKLSAQAFRNNDYEESLVYEILEAERRN